jgi:hypothetical protein
MDGLRSNRPIAQHGQKNRPILQALGYTTAVLEAARGEGYRAGPGALFRPILKTTPLKQDAGRADSTGAGGVVDGFGQHFFNIIAQK